MAVLAKVPKRSATPAVMQPADRMPDLQLWCLALPGFALAPMQALLSAAERQRAGRFRFRGDVERFVKCRGALRLILAASTGEDPRRLDFVEGETGKPALRATGAGIEFNVAHSGDYALIGVGRSPLGVDIERIRADLDWRTIGAAGFHPDEQQAIEALPPEARTDAFFQVWTHKEAYLKGTGRGVATDLAAFRTLLAGGPVRDHAQPTPEPWFTRPLAAPAGYKATVAITSARLDLPALITSLPGLDSRLP
jgi:4'-phosphopantetheinyl transferase